MLHQLRQHYKEIYKKRHQLLQPLTEKEKAMFLKISNELHFNLNNLPGFFFSEFVHSYLLDTPSYVWGTWFYSRFIHKKTIKQAKTYPCLSMNQVYQDLCELINLGYFRLNKAYEVKYVKYLIYECVSLYKELGVLVDVDREKKEIRYDQIPIFEQIEPNIYIELYYNHILPKLNMDLDFKNNEIPTDIQKTVLFFQKKWLNSHNGYYIEEEYKWPNHCKENHLIIYTDQKRLDMALQLLSEEQKKAISTYLKRKPYSIDQICHLLVTYHGASGEKRPDGKYKIYPYVEEYILSSLWLWN
jgi:hypothetical protein